MVLYFKVLSEYYHHIVGDLSDNKKIFLEELHKFILAKDEYGYSPDLSGKIGRVEKLLRWIGEAEAGMSFEEYLILKKWYYEDGWADGEIDEYFLHQKKDKEIKLFCDVFSLEENERDFLKGLNNFLNNKGKILKLFNSHNGKYQTLKEILK